MHEKTAFLSKKKKKLPPPMLTAEFLTRRFFVFSGVKKRLHRYRVFIILSINKGGKNEEKSLLLYFSWVFGKSYLFQTKKL